MKWIHLKKLQEVTLPYNSRGWLYTDSVGNGTSIGGVRFGAHVNQVEIRELAEEMTLKFSYLNLTIGGAKSGICCPSRISLSEREEIFYEFGKALSALIREKAYQPGTDMGTTPEDIHHMLKGAGLASGKKDKDINSGLFTAITVFSALRAAAEASGFDFKKMRVSIQGLGKVGYELLKLVAQSGGTVIAAATHKGCLHAAKGLDSEKLIELVARYGDDAVCHYEGISPISSNEIVTIDTDIFCPCAGSHPINSDNVDLIKTKMIIPGCNVAASIEIEKRLVERNIVYLPGFACNYGGVAVYILDSYGFKGEVLNEFLALESLRKASNLFNLSKKTKISPSDTARQIVFQHQRRFSFESDSSNFFRRALIRVKYGGVSEIIFVPLWELVRSALPYKRGVRRYIARKILFGRLFGL